jgi:hypothetical protein
MKGGNDAAMLGALLAPAGCLGICLGTSFGEDFLLVVFFESNVPKAYHFLESFPA